MGVFDKETIGKTLYISGFDKQDTSESELAIFFDQYQGPSAMKKRVYRFASSDNGWDLPVAYSLLLTAKLEPRHSSNITKITFCIMVIVFVSNGRPNSIRRRDYSRKKLNDCQRRPGHLCNSTEKDCSAFCKNYLSLLFCCNTLYLCKKESRIQSV